MVTIPQTYDGIKLLKHIKEIINTSDKALNISSIRKQLKDRFGINISPVRLSGFLDCAGALGRIIIIRPTVSTSLITNISMAKRHILSTTLVGVIHDEYKKKEDENQCSITEY